MKKLITCIIASLLAFSSVFAQEPSSKLIIIKDTVKYYFIKNTMEEDSIVKGYSSRIVANENYVIISTFGKKDELLEEIIYKHIYDSSRWKEDADYENIYFELLGFKPKDQRYILWFLKNKRTVVTHIHLIELTTDDKILSVLCLGNLKE